MFLWRSEKRLKTKSAHISNLRRPIWKIRAEMETVQSRDRPPRRPSLSQPGANGPRTAVSPGSSEPPGVARRSVWWSSIPANVRPTRPQFIRHLPSPSAVENCSESSSLLSFFLLLLRLLLLFSREANAALRAPRNSKVAPKG